LTLEPQSRLTTGTERERTRADGPELGGISSVKILRNR
jgi:hypothetical protein